eukprot:COSAG02_NODE_791_length_17158_cov_12.377396_13_plen_113_part_00
MRLHLHQSRSRSVRKLPRVAQSQQCAVGDMPVLQRRLEVQLQPANAVVAPAQQLVHARTLLKNFGEMNTCRNHVITFINQVGWATCRCLRFFLYLGSTTNSNHRELVQVDDL